MKQFKIWIILFLTIYCLSPDASSKPILSSLNCESDSSKYSNLCEKYWLYKIPHKVQRLSNTKLQIQIATKKITLEDKETCACDCVWTHYYLAGYYPAIGYLFYETWLSDWNQKTSSYVIPTKPFVTDHGYYFLIDSNSGERINDVSASITISPNNKRFVSVDNQKTGSFLQIFKKNNKSIKEEHRIKFNIGKVEKVHWISNNKLSFTRTFKKENLPSRNISLILLRGNLYEERDKELFVFQDTLLGQNLIQYCSNSQNPINCQSRLEAELIAEINTIDPNSTPQIERRGKKLLLHSQDRSVIMDPETSIDQTSEYRILDKFNGNLLIEQIFLNQHSEYLVFYSAKAKPYRFSSIPKNVGSNRYVVENNKAFQIFHSYNNEELFWIKENNIEKHFGQNYHLIHRQDNHDILFSRAYDKRCETKRYILNWINDRYVLALFDEDSIVNKWNFNRSNYKECKGSLNELDCYTLVEKELLDQDRTTVSKEGEILTFILNNERKITLSPWMFSKDKYFYLGREKKERAPLDGLSYSYLVAKLSDDGKVQYFSVP